MIKRLKPSQELYNIYKCKINAGAQRAEAARAELSVELAQARILPAYELGR